MWDRRSGGLHAQLRREAAYGPELFRPMFSDWGGPGFILVDASIEIVTEIVDPGIPVLRL
jgi:hypothetical protein